MGEMQKSWREAVSRRTALLGGMVTAVGAALATTSAQAGPKVSQASVHFVNVATGDHKCGSCRLFRGPTDCLDVESPVSESCSCRIWLPKSV